jgi:hypothetical protein
MTYVDHGNTPTGAFAALFAGRAAETRAVSQKYTIANFETGALQPGPQSTYDTRTFVS